MRSESPDAAVVLHLSAGPATLESAVAAAQRLRSARPDLGVRIIVNGPALADVVGEAVVEPGDGVTVAACETGLAGRGVPVSQLRPGVATVPVAVVALAEAQLNGAAYIKL